MKTSRFKHTLVALVAASGIGAIATAQDSKPATGVKSADAITKQIVVEGRISFAQQALPFKLDSTDLASDAAHQQLVELAKALQSSALKDVRFEIVGYTCDLGSAEHNLDLSKRRAAAIAALLNKAGVKDARLTIDGLGETKPAVPNSSDENRAKNRRVEIRKISS